MRGRPPPVTGWLIVGLLGIVVALAGCGGEPSSGPTLPSIEFEPKLVLTVADGRLTAAPGPRADAAVRTDPPDHPVVPSGTVAEVVNDGRQDHRLQAGTLFDTGIMRPGEKTTVVLANDTGADLTTPITDALDPAVRAEITVLPRPAG